MWNLIKVQLLYWVFITYSNLSNGKIFQYKDSQDNVYNCSIVKCKLGYEPVKCTRENLGDDCIPCSNTTFSNYEIIRDSKHNKSITCQPR